MSDALAGREGGPAPSVEPGRMREVLGHFASGVTVVTAVTGSGPIGFTCQAFSSLSLDPPLVVFAPARTSRTWPRLRDIGRFCVNVLAEDQTALSQTFARKGTDKFAGVPVGVHFHDTRGTGQANALAAVQAGVTQLDSSVGGLGGCPFAPGASGNIATEELVYWLEESGVATGIDLDALLAAARVAEQAVGHPLPSSLYRAGGRSVPRATASA